ncbi:MAG: hypothetical protein ACYC1E_12350 [Propionibacteriaceae bacterium]
MTSRVALDGGQSGCQGRDADGHLWEGVGIDTSRPRTPQLAAAVRVAAPEGAARVLAGSTGLGVEDTAAALLAELADHGTREVYLAHDSVTSYLGALAPTDEVAAQVLRDAAAELVTSVTTGLRLVDGHEDDPICVLGKRVPQRDAVVGLRGGNPHARALAPVGARSRYGARRRRPPGPGRDRPRRPRRPLGRRRRAGHPS